MPAEIRDDFSARAGMEPDVIEVAQLSNGLRSSTVAANAASLRSKLLEAARLVEAGDLARVGAVIGAALAELDEQR